MQAYPAPGANQAYTNKALTKLLAASFRSSRASEGLISLAQWYNAGQKKTTLNGDSTCHIIQWGQVLLNAVRVFLRLP